MLISSKKIIISFFYFNSFLLISKKKPFSQYDLLLGCIFLNVMNENQDP